MRGFKKSITRQTRHHKKRSSCNILLSEFSDPLKKRAQTHATKYDLFLWGRGWQNPCSNSKGRTGQGSHAEKRKIKTQIATGGCLLCREPQRTTHKKAAAPTGKSDATAKQTNRTANRTARLLANITQITPGENRRLFFNGQTNSY